VHRRGSSPSLRVSTSPPLTHGRCRWPWSSSPARRRITRRRVGQLPLEWCVGVLRLVCGDRPRCRVNTIKSLCVAIFTKSPGFFLLDRGCDHDYIWSSMNLYNVMWMDNKI
jgi:hypothetical protein